MTRTLLVASLLALPGSAWACGGFFCNNSAPVEQTGEDIFFHISEGTVEAHVQITYEGPAEEFAWIVPVPEVPELGIGTDVLFQQLAQQLTPVFQLDYDIDGDCKTDNKDYADSGAIPTDPSSGTASSSADAGGVTVVETAQIGPYDTVILLADDTTALLDWLNDNGYDLPLALDPLLDPYVAGGQAFVALKLSKNRDAGDLAPLVMTYSGDAASIPIQLTSVAATPDMRLRVNILGDHRAVPESYLHLDLNPFAVDWWTGGSNYDQVVTRAAFEAGGHGFATDYAGKPAPMRDRLYNPTWDTDRLANTGGAIAFVELVISDGYPATQTLLDVLEPFFPNLDSYNGGVELRDLFNCPSCYSGYDPIFDAAGAADAVDTFIVSPRRNLDEMFSGAGTLTRMTSSISPVDMTIDPVFVVNGDLPDVDNWHTATQTIECGNKRFWYDEAPQRLSIGNYPDLLLPSQDWLTTNNMDEHDYILSLHEPSNALIEAAYATGPNDIVVDNRSLIEENILAFNDEHEADRPKAGCGCSHSGPANLAWMLLPLLAVARRRG